MTKDRVEREQAMTVDEVLCRIDGWFRGPVEIWPTRWGIVLSGKINNVVVKLLHSGTGSVVLQVDGIDIQLRLWRQRYKARILLNRGIALHTYRKNRAIKAKEEGVLSLLD